MGTPQIAVIEEGNLPPSLDTKTSSETSAKTSFEKKFANAQIPTLKTPVQKPPRGAAPLPELEGELLDLKDDWERWQKHLIQKGKPMTPLQAEAQIALLWKMSHDEAVESIDRAIVGGYSAFLLPKTEEPKKTQEAPSVVL